MKLSTKHFRRTSLCLALGGVIAASAPTMKARNIAATDYRDETKSSVVREALLNGTLIKVSAANPYGLQDKPVFQATEDYYRGFTYTWKSSVDGSTHVSNLTESATDPNQIVALLTEVYTNPDIPGYVEDISFVQNADGSFNHDWFTGQLDLSKDDGSILDPGYYMVWQNNYEGKYNNTTTAMSRANHNVVDYSAANFHPFAIKTAPQVPLNGATALLVEMKPEYYSKNPNGTYGDPIGNVMPGENPNVLAQRALDYVSAVTLLPRQQYVDMETSSNPGFLFNIEGNYSKCFIVSKGSPRPDKVVMRKLRDDHGNFIMNPDGSFYEHASGALFYSMFEEFSPANTGPMTDAYKKMNNGEPFTIDHNCSSIISQQHDMIMGAEDTYETRNEKFHINMMFFIPDLRFDADTSMLPKDRWDNGESEEMNSRLYSPYTYYAANHRPYMFFSQIAANIDGKADISSEAADNVALIPLTWTSNYKTIVGQKAPESFWVFRVIDGEMESLPIPLDQLEIRAEQKKTDDGKYVDEATMLAGGTWEYDTDGSIVRAESETVKIYVREPYVAGDSQFGGKEVTYIVLGARKDSHFNLVESNTVTTTLPYSSGNANNFTLSLERAKSVYDFENQRNIYSNTVEYITAGEGETDGNLLATDLLTSVPQGDFSTWGDNLRKGTFNIYRSWTDVMTGRTREELIHSLPFNENSLMKVNGTVVIRLADASVIAAESTLADPVEPYRNLATLREKGIAGQPVKAAIVLKRNLNDLKTDDWQIKPWESIGQNNGLLGFFVDDNNFSVSTTDNAYPSSYRYRMEFVADDKTRTSNHVDALVAKREMFAGFMGYTAKDIESDNSATFTADHDMYDLEDGLLLPNADGVAVKVSTNTNIKAYNIYHLPGGNLAERRLAAFAERRSDGSFHTFAVDKNNRVVDKGYTAGAYSGKLPIVLETVVNPGDLFALEIETIDSENSPYRGNTYGGAWKVMPSRPKLYVDNVQIKSGGSGQYEYSVTFIPEIPQRDLFDEFGYGLWGYVHDNYDNSSNFFPHGAIFDAKYHTPSGMGNATLITPGNNSLNKGGYSFSHAILKPTAKEKVVVTNVARAYLKMNPEIAIGTNDNEPMFFVADNTSMHGLGGNDTTTGVDDIVAGEGENNYRYYNLEGIEVDGENLTRGIYIRTNGVTTEKISVK